MIRRKFDHPHVVLCRTCCGRGFLENLDELTDTVSTMTCPACKGSGRVVVSSVTLTTVEPYDPESPNLALYGKGRTEGVSAEKFGEGQIRNGGDIG